MSRPSPEQMERRLTAAPDCTHKRKTGFKDANGRGLCVQCSCKALGIPWPPKRISDYTPRCAVCALAVREEDAVGWQEIDRRRYCPRCVKRLLGRG